MTRGATCCSFAISILKLGRRSWGSRGCSAETETNIRYWISFWRLRSVPILRNFWRSGWTSRKINGGKSWKLQEWTKLSSTTQSKIITNARIPPTSKESKTNSKKSMSTSREPTLKSYASNRKESTRRRRSGKRRRRSRKMRWWGVSGSKRSICYGEKETKRNNTEGSGNAREKNRGRSLRD